MEQDRAVIVDEFGELQRQIRLFAPVLQREQVLRRIILNWFLTTDAELGAACDGYLYRVTVSPRARERRVNCRELYEKLGEDFWDNATYPLKSFDTLVIDHAGLIFEERTGSRSVQSVLREAVSGPEEVVEEAPPRPKPEPRQPPPRKPRGGKPTKRAAGRAHARGEARA